MHPMKQKNNRQIVQKIISIKTEFKFTAHTPCCCGYYFHISSTIQQPEVVVMVFQVTSCVQSASNYSTHLQNPKEHAYKRSGPWQIQTLSSFLHQQQNIETQVPLVGNFHEAAVVFYLHPRCKYTSGSFQCMGLPNEEAKVPRSFFIYMNDATV